MLFYSPPTPPGLFALNTEISVSILFHSLIRDRFKHIQIQQTDLAYRLLSLHSVKACEDFYRRINKTLSAGPLSALSAGTRAAPVCHSQRRRRARALARSRSCVRAGRPPHVNATLSARSPAVEYAGQVVRERELGNCFMGPRHHHLRHRFIKLCYRPEIHHMRAAGQRISKFA